MDRVAAAYSEFALSISPKKTNIMAQNISTRPAISTGDHILDVVENFTYRSSNIANNLSLDVELNVKIGKAATATARLAKRVGTTLC